MRLSERDRNRACRQRSVRGASSPRRSLTFGPIQTGSRWTSADQGSRPTTLALHNAPHELIELRPMAEAMEFARFLR